MTARKTPADAPEADAPEADAPEAPVPAKNPTVTDPQDGDEAVMDPFAGRYDPAPVTGRHPDHPHPDGTWDAGCGPRR